MSCFHTTHEINHSNSQPPNHQDYIAKSIDLQRTKANMSVISDSALRRRYSIDEMPSSTDEFSGAELQFCDRSPTATPVQTRSGSPVRGILMPHTAEQSSRFMEDVHAIARKDTPKKLNLAGDKIMASVGAIDGSANVDTMIKIKFLAVYFFFNLGLTLYNKAVMIQVSRASICDSPFHLPFSYLSLRFLVYITSFHVITFDI